MPHTVKKTFCVRCEAAFFARTLTSSRCWRFRCRDVEALLFCFRTDFLMITACSPNSFPLTGCRFVHTTLPSRYRQQRQPRVTSLFRSYLGSYLLPRPEVH